MLNCQHFKIDPYIHVLIYQGYRVYNLSLNLSLVNSSLLYDISCPPFNDLYVVGMSHDLKTSVKEMLLYMKEASMGKDGRGGGQERASK